MSNVVIVDTSIALKWVLEESDSAVAQALLADWIDQGLVILAPTLLAYEITNSLYRRTRTGEITLDKAKQSLTKILLTGLELDFSQDPDLSKKAMELASHFNLPATYDSHYLALAAREDCDFWTADAKLWRAVRGELTWVRWLGDYQSAS